MNDTYKKHLQTGEQAGRPYRLLIPRETVSGHYGYHDAYSSGASLDYKDFREYQPGDDLRHIDWNAYARSDRLVIKIFRQEVNPHVDLVIDASRSMALVQTAKASASLGLAALIATAAFNAKCSLCAWKAADGCRPVTNGRDRPSHWTDIDFDARQAIPEALAILPPKFQPGSIRVLISDLLFPGNPESVLLKAAQGASLLIVLQILAENDLNPDFSGNIRVEDAETGRTASLAFDDRTRSRYQARLGLHQQNWYAATVKFGAKLISFTAEKLIADWSVLSLQSEGILAKR